MTDRLAQARAEAERTVGGPADPPRDRHSGFMEGLHWGVVWADANPQPHTITRKRLREFTLFVLDQADDARGVRWAVAHLLGIEVTDDAD